VAFSPTGKTLASAGGDNCIKLWDITKWQSPTIVRPSQTTCWALAFSPDSKDLAFVHKIPNGLLHFWDVASGQVRRTLSTANALGLAYSADGGTLAATHVAGLRFIDLSTGQETNVPVAATREIAFSPDGTLVATGSEEHTVKLWDLITGRPLKPLAGHTNEVPGVKFSPDGRILASASQDKTVKLWDVATWEERATLRGHKGQVWSITFTADGKSLISAGGDIKVWDIDTAKERLTLHRKTGSYHAWHLALSPDGKALATTSSNPASLTFWDTASWQERATLRWHPAIIRAIQFSPDGSMLATGAEDNTVTLWRAATEAEVRAQSSVLDKSEKR
jgi:WD40 repeat protein